MARIWGIGSFLLVMLGIVLGVFVANDYRQTQRFERERLSAVAALLSANLADELKATSAMLVAMRDDIPTLLSEPKGLERISRRMAIICEGVPVVRSMVYVNADGDIIASTIPELLGKHFKDSERYKTIKAGSDPQVSYLSAPYSTPIGNYTVSVGKVLLDRQGIFNGYILGILDPKRFGSLFNSLLYAPDMRISIAHSDGIVVFSTQTTPDIRGVDLHEVAGSPFNVHMASGQSTSFITDRSTLSDKSARLLAIRTIEPPSTIFDKALVVAVSRDATAAIAKWRSTSIQIAALYFVLLALTCIGLWALSRRKRAYQQLEFEATEKQAQAQRQLDELNTRFRGYFENMSAGAVQLGPDGLFELVNHCYCEITGYSPDELVGKMKLSDITHPDDIQAERGLMEDFWSNTLAEIDLEKRIITKDGRIVWVHVLANAVRDHDGEVKYTTGVIEDITQRKQLVTDLEEAKSAAEVANRAKTLFLGNMSHEMRTPLHQIAGIASMFRRDTLTEKQTHRLGLLDEATKRLESVIGGILTLVSLESGTTKLKLGPISFKDIVERVISTLKERSRGKNVSLNYCIDPLPEPLLGDGGHIQTIVASYLSNAITFSEKGSIEVFISCLQQDAGSALIRIAVSDEGVGVAPKDLARIFDRFEQADNSHTRQYSGTGVGLGIVKKLAKLMGGDAGCESTLGQGSTFWATILMPKQLVTDAQTSSSDLADFQI